ncbi:anhydro-N-acetylmuramic acid kinase [Actibacterium pelagium]|uniref:Anhydro-N-acetylmuramic acid kinase n=1 Tax=Actibacterium pelagium TaxID=2029103 RepID=A0A917EIL3_9RHOB|nr:anhydro-N-acetylmuramic acid kinase [Actibacterium pelagium]GGE40748.1 anhydro-N-acetylmuramic acid kinase [Actibacterium pelagium]
MKKTGPIKALGAMSGTSLDGVDAAEVETDGHRIFGFGESRYLAYEPEERTVLRSALGCWPGNTPVPEAARVVEDAHVRLLGQFATPDVIGFHGQTLAHDPQTRGTHQAGNGAVLANALGCPVVWDFRSADVGLGGQGAPLAPFFHFACAQWAGEKEPVAFLNLGGVGNVTWVDPTADTPETPGALLAFDTGPANALIDDLVSTRLLRPYDKDGEIAATGRISIEVMTWFEKRPFFSRMPPKSLDRNDFHELAGQVSTLSTADAVTTLTACTADAVARGMAHFPRPVSKVLVAGGGRKNRSLMAMLSASSPCPVLPVEEIGLDGDMLEAQAFAYLAVRVSRGMPTSAPGTTGVSVAIGGGQLSYPKLAEVQPD